MSFFDFFLILFFFLLYRLSLSAFEWIFRVFIPSGWLILFDSFIFFFVLLVCLRLISDAKENELFHLKCIRLPYLGCFFVVFCIALLFNNIMANYVLFPDLFMVVLSKVCHIRYYVKVCEIFRVTSECDSSWTVIVRY